MRDLTHLNGAFSLQQHLGEIGESAFVVDDTTAFSPRGVGPILQTVS